MKIKTVLFNILMFLCLMINPFSLGYGKKHVESDFRARVLLVAGQEAILSSQLNSAIRKIHVHKGDHFQKGQPLIDFDCSILEAEERKSNIDFEIAHKNLILYQRLSDYNGASEMEMDAAKGAVSRSIGEKDRILTQKKYCTIYAPFDGRVFQLNAHEHEYYGPGQALMSVVSTKKLKIEMLIPALWSSWVTVGKKFRIVIDELKKDFEAVVTGTGVRVDPASQSLEVFAEVTGDHPELMIGMSGEAVFDRESEESSDQDDRDDNEEEKTSENKDSEKEDHKNKHHQKTELPKLKIPDHENPEILKKHLKDIEEYEFPEIKDEPDQKDTEQKESEQKEPEQKE